MFIPAGSFVSYIRLILFEHISDISYGADHRSILSELLAQRLDMHIKRPGLALKIGSPHALHDDLSRHYHAAVCH